MALRVLLGVDDSPWSGAAAQVALDLLRRMPDAELTALHVVNVVAPSGSLLKDLPGRLGFEPAIVPPEVEQQYTEAGNRLLAGLKADASDAGLTLTTVLDHGAVAERVTHHGATADLVIVGLRGETEQRFPGQGGSNIMNLLQGLSATVMLVPHDVRKVGNVVIGFDGSDAARRALRSLAAVREHIDVAVHAVFVDRSGGGDGGVLDAVDAALEGVTVQHHVLTDVSVREGLVQVARDNDANLLAIGFSGKSRIRDFFFGSSYESLVLEDSLILMIAH